MTDLQPGTWAIASPVSLCGRLHKHPSVPLGAHSPSLSAEVETEDKGCLKQIKKELALEANLGLQDWLLLLLFWFLWVFWFCFLCSFSVSAQTGFKLLILLPLSPRTEITGVYTTPHPAHAVLGTGLRAMCV